MGKDNVFKIAGVEVSKETYDALTKKMYDIPAFGPLPLATVELYAYAKDVERDYPEASRACREAINEVLVELTGGKAHTGGFADHIQALRSLYDNATKERATMSDRFKRAENSWKEDRGSNLSEAGMARAVADFKEAQETYKNGLKELYDKTEKRVGEIRTHLEDDLKSFYGPDGKWIDDDAVRLLNSGIVLSESEVADLVEKFAGNPTMLRICGQYAKTHKIAAEAVGPMLRAASSGGSNELKVFDRVAAPLLWSIGSDETSAKVWGPERGHFYKRCDEAILELSTMVVRP